MRLTIVYSKIKKWNLVLIINDTYQRETLSERPILQPLRNLSVLLQSLFIADVTSFAVVSLYYVIRGFDLVNFQEAMVPCAGYSKYQKIWHFCPLRGNYTSDQIWAWFVCYLKIINTVLKYNLRILKQIVWATQKWHCSPSDSWVFDQNNILHNNFKRTAWPTKIFMSFLVFSGNLHQDAYRVFFFFFFFLQKNHIGDFEIAHKTF